MSKSLEIGLVGLPNVGKSSLFNALTKNDILVANYPFATIEPNTGIVSVPDERLIRLQEFYKSEKIIPATVEFFDIAGLVEGASSGEGLGNKFLSHIRQTNLIVHVVRVFKDQNIVHVMNNIMPKNDIDVINTELVLADLESIDRQLPKLEKELKSDSKLKDYYEYVKRCKSFLEDNKPLWTMDEVDNIFNEKLSLLTTKPIIYLFNLDEEDLSNENLKLELNNLVKPAATIFISAKLEDSLKNLERNEQLELLALYDQKESGLNKLIKLAYEYLSLQSFLTAGEKEVRAWTVKKGTTAPKAAGEIHGDFERGFIAAEIISYQDLIAYDSYFEAKKAGKVRLEGKNYIMQNDDIVDFKFNV